MGQLPNSDFPYVDQTIDQNTMNENASSWCLNQIKLPSGGNIDVVYEADDYAYVQNKKAMQMMRIAAVENNSGQPQPATGWTSLSDGGDGNRDIFVLKEPGTTAADYMEGGSGLVYFRALMDMGGGGGSKADYVSGYANAHISDAGNYVRISFDGVSLANSGGAGGTSPIVKSAIQFGRLNLSKLMWGNDQIDEDGGLGVQFLEALIQSNFISNIADAINGPNNAIYDDGKGRDVHLSKSFVRLMVPDGKKYGGGCRVKEIRLNDNWQEMTNDPTSTYGQKYAYTLQQNGREISSGVASYEPQLGGDENPWRQPDFFSVDACMAPDDEHYKQLPYGESFFPSPVVGYSKVVVESLEPDNVTHHGTGKVVHEFYTAKDFPTIVDQTIIDPHRKHTNKASLESLFGIDYQEYLTVSQGFSVELNDMHGKPKRESVYQEDYSGGINTQEPITSVEYIYKSEIVGGGNEAYNRLKNDVTVIKPNGTTGSGRIGVLYDFVADFREHQDRTQSGGAQINVDAFIIPMIPPIPMVVPMVLPSYSNERTVFRSAATCKVINRFGILEKTIAKDLGSVVSTQNLAYDSETGEVLLTQVTNDFNDSMYALTYPAHWVYDGMGLSYENIGYSTTAQFDANGYATISNAGQFFVPGDEVMVNLPGGLRGWITEVDFNKIKMVNKQGLTIIGTKVIKIVRSGRRNMQSTPVATISSLTNPLNAISVNVFENVLQASAIEFSDLANAGCDCFYIPETDSYTSINPYVIGTKGNWRMSKTYAHLSPRAQTRYDNNTNVRRDGVMTAYSPFYRVSNSGWVKNSQGWTYASEVTEYSHNGMELENKDALNRYSAATYSFNQTANTSVSSNAGHKELRFASFEDFGYPGCGDNGFDVAPDLHYIAPFAHTGRKSLVVSAGNPLTYSESISACEEEVIQSKIFNIKSEGATYSEIQIELSGPISRKFEVLQGNPYVVYSDSKTIKITNESGALYRVRITITDSNNKTYSQIYAN
jgi:hypothetical protein